MQKTKETYVFLFFPEFIKNSPFALPLLLDHFANLNLEHKATKKIDQLQNEKILKQNVDEQWLLSMLMMPSTDVKYKNAYQELFSSSILVIILESSKNFSEKEITKISQWLNSHTADNKPMTLGFAGERAKKLIISI